MIRIRKCTSNDIPHVLTIEKKAHVAPWTEGIFYDCLRVNYECWLLEEDNQIIAYGIMNLSVGEAHLMNLAVMPEKQNQGYGQQLLTHLIQIAKQRNFMHMFLEVRKSNETAIKLYEKFGFNQIGERKNYYPAVKGHEREDAIILALSLETE